MIEETGGNNMILEVKNLVKRYKNLLAVDNVNLEINEGEIFGLLGPNGAGKTTTIRMVTGLAKSDSGEIRILGKDFSGHEMDTRKNIGIVPQDIAVFDDLSAQENLHYFGRLYGLKPKELKENIDSALEFTGRACRTV
jgi:ABC-2 type transport system ATP-binding protein